jgi:phosphoribosyl 1,2-cyclic phosphate phosphodiesterase
LSQLVTLERPWGFAVKLDPHARQLTGQLVFLGTGTSVGVPLIGCGCEVCQSTDPHNKRTRCGLAVGLPEGILLVDTPTDLRHQLLRERIAVAHGVAYTHAHSDHMNGIDELRAFSFWTGQPIPIYAEPLVAGRLQESFAYCFQPTRFRDAGPALPQLEIEPIGLDPFPVLGATVLPIRLLHGRLPTLGYRFGDVAYCTDVSEIPNESFSRLDGLDVLILDCLRYEPPHPTHLTVDQAVALAERIGARRTIMTHISHSLDHETTNSDLPAGMELAYDGMTLPIGIGGLSY